MIRVYGIALGALLWFCISMIPQAALAQAGEADSLSIDRPSFPSTPT